jgi:RHS repeat-associated protein
VLAETVVVLPVLALLGLSVMQWAFIYEAKSALNHATFMATRAGTTNQADPAAIRLELARSLAPLYSPDRNLAGLLRARARAAADIVLNARLRILNPTREAFDDFGVDSAGDGVLEIPFERLHVADTRVGPASGVNIQDANLLKLEVVYGYELKVPFAGPVIATLASWFNRDPYARTLLARGRLPILATATVRMQSAARENDLVADRADVRDAYRSDPTVVADASRLGHRPWKSGPTGSGTDGASGFIPVADDPGGAEGGGNGGNGDSDDDGGSNEGDAGGSTGLGSPDSCDGSDAPAATDAPGQGRAVGNPIDVVTGNKYQAETDLSPLPGPLGLRFVRHYNSRLEQDGALGYGWRHSYMAALERIDGESIRLRQSDGRLLVFRREPGERVYRATAATDGAIEPLSHGYDWVWHDGRRLLFDREGRLTDIRQADGRSVRLVHDAEGRLAGVTDPQGRRLTFLYGDGGRLAGVIDPGGLRYLYRYDRHGNLETVTYPDGAVRTYHYEDSRDPHNLTGLTDERGVRFATWAYDEHDRAVLSTHAEGVGRVELAYSPGATEVTDALGRISRHHIAIVEGLPRVSRIEGPGCTRCGSRVIAYRYGTGHQVTALTLRDGRTRHYRFDNLQRLVEISESAPDGKGGTAKRLIARYAYTGLDLRPLIIAVPGVNPAGLHHWWLGHDGPGRIQEVLEVGYAPDYSGGFEEMLRSTRYEYEDGRLMAVDGPVPGDSDRVSYHYDNRGRLTHTTRGGKILGWKVTAFDAYGRPGEMVDAHGMLRTFEYDSRGRLKRLTLKRPGAVPRTVVLEHDAMGQIIAIGGPAGRARIGYDLAGRPISLESEPGLGRRWRWDNADRLLARGWSDGSDDELVEVAYGYGAGNMPESLRDPLGNRYRFDYDMAGRLRALTNPLGEETRYHHDPWGQLVAVSRAVGTPYEATEKRKYDAAGRVIEITDPRGNASLRTYDDFGNLLYRANPDGGMRMYRHNASGQVIARVDESGVITRFDYDEQGRLVGVGPFHFSATTKIRYDEKGRRVEEDGLHQVTRLTYDREDRVIEKVVTLKDLGRTYTTAYRYDHRGRLVEKTLPGGEILRFRYNQSGDVVHVDRKRWLRDQALVESMTLDRAGRISALEFANGAYMRMDYGPLGRLSVLETSHTGTSRYRYDALGRLVAIETAGEERRYTYDPQGHLTGVWTGAGETTWRYDLNGNRLSQNMNGDVIKYAYDRGSNRLLRAGNEEYRYDATGKTLQKGEMKLEYNAGGRLARVYQGERLIAEYGYNTEGERIRKTVHKEGGSEVTWFLYENGKIVGEVTAEGKVSRQYIYHGVRPLLVSDSSGMAAIESDFRYTPAAASPLDEAEHHAIDLAPFGAFLGERPNGYMNLRMPGQYSDEETGLYYNLFRDYDPDAGRYLTPDPLGEMAGLNGFSYVNSDPLNRIDYDGLYSRVVHYYLTYFLALVAGVPPDLAIVLASADQYIDDNPKTSPFLGGPRALGSYHFIMADEKIANDPEKRPLDPFSDQLGDLYESAMLPTRACINNGSDPVMVKAQLYGEYLHALEDTFGHRDEMNIPYSVFSWKTGIGHALHGGYPDYTYNFRLVNSDQYGNSQVMEWNYNELRTLQMEKEVLYSIRRDYKSEIEQRRTDAGLPVRTDAEYEKETAGIWEDIAGDGSARVGLPGGSIYKPEVGKTSVMQEFNKTEDHGLFVSGEYAKIKVLNSWLNNNGYQDMVAYNKSSAKGNRKKYLNNLSSSDFKGVVLE